MEYLHALNGPLAYLLICLLLMVEEAGIPLPMLPGDVILLAGGYLAAIGVVHLSLLLLGGYAACVAGALLCHRFSRSVGRGVVLRYGRFVGLGPSRLGRAERWLRRNGVAAVAVARVLPGTRINMSFAAGCLRLPVRDFLLGVLPSTAVWLGGFTLLGFVLGDRVTPLLPWYDRIAVGLIAVAVAGGAGAWWLRRRRGGAMRTGQGQVA